MARTLVDLFRSQVEKSGDRPALRHRVGSDWQAISWSEYGEQVAALALALDHRRISRHDTVAIISSCRPEYFICDLAANWVGAASASIYVTSAPAQMAYVLDNADSRIIFCEDDKQVAKTERIRGEFPDLLTVGFTGDAADVSFAELLAEGREYLAAEPGRLAELSQVAQPEDPACLIYTSGTTGPPKAALIPHSTVLRILEALRLAFPTETPFRTVSYLPLAHIAERNVSLYSQLLQGGEVWFGSVPTLVDDLGAARPTRLLGVPRVWEKCATALRARAPIPGELTPGERRELLASIGLDQVDVAITGAAPISVDTISYFHALGLELLEAYGMTETGGFSTSNPRGAARLGTVGTAVAGVEVRLADDGELLIRGANFSGYHRNPEATATALEGGWIHSGDLALIDDYGYVTITGRKKDLIITAGGENISPAAIQLLLTSSPYIAQAVVIGDRRRFVSALLTLSEPELRAWAADHGLADLTLAELARHPAVRELIGDEVNVANSRLARVQQVKRFAICERDFSIEAGELTPTMKLRRDVIERVWADEIEGLYA